MGFWNGRFMTGSSPHIRGPWPAIGLILGLMPALLAGCTNPPAPPGGIPVPATGPVAAAPAAADPPPKQYEASAECWMKYDKATGNLDAKAKLVNKCIDDKMKGTPPAKK
jgi:hypothetical protein